MVYGCKQSHVVDETRDGPAFVQVWNENTPEFDQLELGKAIKDIDMQKVLGAVLDHRKEHDKGRGTKQLNLLFTGGENQRREAKEISEDFGCAMPAVNEGTEKWVDVAVKMSEIGRKVGIWWAKPSNLKGEDRERHDMFAGSIHKKNCFQGLTLSALELWPKPQSVKEHTDILNCRKQSHVLCVSQLLWHQNKLYRVCLIAYQRKACFDSFVRRNACKEVAESTTRYLSALPTHLLPKETPEDYKSFYKFMGELGLGVVVEIVNGEEDKIQNGKMSHMKVISVTLMNRPHMDKPFSYLSGVTSAIATVFEKNKHLSERDLLLMCLPIGQLNGLFPYLTVLWRMASHTDIDNTGPLGILDIIITHLFALTGSYSGGSFPRAQVSWNRGRPDIKRTLEDIEVIQWLCSESSDTPPVGKTYKAYCTESYARFCSIFRRKIFGVGGFGAQHLVVALAQIGRLKPEGIVQCAEFSVGTTTLKEKKSTQPVPNPKMLKYLNGASTQAERSGRASRVMQSVLPHLQDTKQMVWMTTSILEQCNCEKYRGKGVADFYGPAGFNFWYQSSGTEMLGKFWELKPTVDEYGGISGVTKQAKRVLPLRANRMKLGKYKEHLWPDNKGSIVMCRVPWEQIEAAAGLSTEVRAKVLSGKFEDVCLWVQEHPKLQELIMESIRRPQAIPKANVIGFGIPLAVTGDEDCQEGCTQVTVVKKRTTQFSEVTEVRYYDPSSSPIPIANAGVLKKEASKRRTGSFKMAEVEQHSVKSMSGNAIDDKKVAVKMNEIETNEIRTREFFDEVEFGRSVVVSDTITHYRFHTHEATKVVTGWKPATMTSGALKGLKIHTVKLCSIYSELKRCVHSGVPEREMPNDLNKKMFTTVLCNDTTHEVTHTDNLFMVRWKSNPRLDFFTVGTCTQADTIAMLLGGIRVKSKQPCGVSHWLFKTIEQAKYYMIVCLIVLAGKVTYFAKLYKKLNKAKDDTISKDDAPCEVYRLVVPDKNLETIMYAAVSKKDKYENGWNKWSLSFPGPNSRIIERRDLLHGIWFDVWSWKRKDMKAFDSVENHGEKCGGKRTNTGVSMELGEVDELTCVVNEKGISTPTMTRRQRKRLKQEWDEELFAKDPDEIDIDEVWSDLGMSMDGDRFVL